MELIKVRYVALVGIDTWTDANDPHNLPYDEIKRNVGNGIIKELKECLKDIAIKECLKDIAIDEERGEVTVIQLLADVWKENK